MDNHSTYKQMLRMNWSPK